MKAKALPKMKVAKIQIRWTPVDSASAKYVCQLEALGQKDKVTECKDKLLEDMRIRKQPSETHMEAFIRTMAAENNVTYEEARHQISNEGKSNPDLLQFLTVLM